MLFRSLEKNGYEVHLTEVDFAGSVEKRSQQLAEQVRKIAGAVKVDIIAHSMGGLDARHMIVDIPGMADKVASLTTIGTPHLGSPVADAVAAGDPGAIKLLKPIFDLTGIRDLTTESCEKFNARAKLSEGNNAVVYRAYAASEEAGKMVPPLAQLSALFFTTPNDGAVSVKSQLWKSSLPASDGIGKPVGQLDFGVPADHLNELGWWDPLESSGWELIFGAPAAAQIGRAHV